MSKGFDEGVTAPSTSTPQRQSQQQRPSSAPLTRPQPPPSYRNEPRYVTPSPLRAPHPPPLLPLSSFVAVNREGGAVGAGGEGGGVGVGVAGVRGTAHGWGSRARFRALFSRDLERERRGSESSIYSLASSDGSFKVMKGDETSGREREDDIKHHEMQGVSRKSQGKEEGRTKDTTVGGPKEKDRSWPSPARRSSSSSSSSSSLDLQYPPFSPALPLQNHSQHGTRPQPPAPPPFISSSVTFNHQQLSSIAEATPNGGQMQSAMRGTTGTSLLPRPHHSMSSAHSGGRSSSFVREGSRFSNHPVPSLYRPSGSFESMGDEEEEGKRTGAYHIAQERAPPLSRRRPPPLLHRRLSSSSTKTATSRSTSHYSGPQSVLLPPVDALASPRSRRGISLGVRMAIREERLMWCVFMRRKFNLIFL